MKQHPVPGEPFKLAAIEVHTYLASGVCDKAIIKDCIDATQRLIETDLEHDAEHPSLMFHINAALTNIYPHMGDAQAPELIGLLQEEKESLEKILDGKTLNEEEGLRVNMFCREMGVQLRLLEIGQEPHHYSEGRK